MHIKSRKAVVSDALEDWRSRGLLDPDTAARLSADLDQGRRRYGFNAFIITAGVVCLCFAALSFVAANWDQMSRLTRFALILITLWSAWGAAIWTGLRGQHWWQEALMLLGCGIFGAGIMLVSQIYHIQGNAADAVWLWALGTLMATVLTRGEMVLALSIGLFALWHLMQLDLAARTHDLNLDYLVWWLAGAGLAWWQRSRIAAHLSVIAFCVWVLSALATAQFPHAAALLVLAGSIGVTSACIASLSGPRLLHGFEAALLGYAALLLGLILFYLTLTHNAYDRLVLGPMIGPVQGDGTRPILQWSMLPVMLVPSLVLAAIARLRGWPFAYDLAVSLGLGVLLLFVHLLPKMPLLSEAVLLGPFIWITRMGWRLDLRGLRVIGMAGFVLALLVIYGETVGSLIGTSGFYLGAGLILLGGAWVATRLDPGQGGGS